MSKPSKHMWRCLRRSVKGLDVQHLISWSGLILALLLEALDDIQPLELQRFPIWVCVHRASRALVRYLLTPLVLSLLLCAVLADPLGALRLIQTIADCECTELLVCIHLHYNHQGRCRLEQPNVAGPSLQAYLWLSVSTYCE